MRLGSSALLDGAPIPRRFTCDGEDLSPPLEWTGAPAGARSFTLLCDDPDAPSGTWHHWAAYDIPSTLTMLAQGAASNAEKLGFKQAINGPAMAPMPAENTEEPAMISALETALCLARDLEGNAGETVRTSRRTHNINWNATPERRFMKCILGALIRTGLPKSDLLAKFKKLVPDFQ